MSYKITYGKETLYFSSYYEAVCEKNKLLKKGIKNIELKDTKKDIYFKKKTQRKVLCVETGEIYDNAKIASEDKECNPKTIIKVLLNKPHYNTAGGYSWEYIYV